MRCARLATALQRAVSPSGTQACGHTHEPFATAVRGLHASAPALGFLGPYRIRKLREGSSTPESQCLNAKSTPKLPGEEAPLLPDATCPTKHVHPYLANLVAKGFLTEVEADSVWKNIKLKRTAAVADTAAGAPSPAAHSAHEVRLSKGITQGSSSEPSSGADALGVSSDAASNAASELSEGKVLMDDAGGPPNPTEPTNAAVPWEDLSAKGLLSSDGWTFLGVMMHRESPEPGSKVSIYIADPVRQGLLTETEGGGGWRKLLSKSNVDAIKQAMGGTIPSVETMTRTAPPGSQGEAQAERIMEALFDVHTPEADHTMDLDRSKADAALSAAANRGNAGSSAVPDTPTAPTVGDITSAAAQPPYSSSPLACLERLAGCTPSPSSQPDMQPEVLCPLHSSSSDSDSDGDTTEEEKYRSDEDYSFKSEASEWDEAAASGAAAEQPCCYSSTDEDRHSLEEWCEDSQSEEWGSDGHHEEWGDSEHEEDRADEVVTLDAGGSLMATARSTLRRGGPLFLNRFLLHSRGMYPIALEQSALEDEKGLPFVDADPVLFSHVLDYLRHGKIPARALRSAELMVDLRYLAEALDLDQLSNDISAKLEEREGRAFNADGPAQDAPGAEGAAMAGAESAMWDEPEHRTRPVLDRNGGMWAAPWQTPSAVGSEPALPAAPAASVTLDVTTPMGVPPPGAAMKTIYLVQEQGAALQLPGPGARPWIRRMRTIPASDPESVQYEVAWWHAD